MRKLYFCGLAAAVTLAAGAFLSAAYANRHPDTWVGRCVATTYTVATETTTLRCIKFGFSSIDHRGGAAAAASAEKTSCCKPPCESADSSEPGCHSLTDADGVVLKQLPVTIQPGGNEESGDMPPIPEVQPIPVQVPPAAPEFEPAAPHMPPCPDDEVLIRPMDPVYPVETLSEDEIGKDLAGAPSNDEPPMCEGNSSSLAKSLVDFCGSMIRSMLPAAAGCPETIPSSGATEESETVEPGTPSKCQEDPHSSEQYPGCPFMGRCPSGRESVIPVLPETIGKPRMEGNGEQNQSNQETLPQSKSEPTWQIPLVGAEVWNSWAPPSGSEPTSTSPSLKPNVDTTEFRSSDARPDEFEPKPY